jgi:hypothetical protein
MDALLIATTAHPVEVAAQHPHDVAALREALGDAHGDAVVDAVVDAFTHGSGGGEALAMVTAPADDGALAALFGSAIAGPEFAAFAPAFDMNTMLHELSAAGAAQA